MPPRRCSSAGRRSATSGPDAATGGLDRSTGPGDITLALRRNLRNPDGSGTSLAVMAQATLPTGGSAIGAGDWGASVLLPVGFDLAGSVGLALVPEVSAAVDADRHGRHLAYGGVVGLELQVAETLTATGEISLVRDDDAAGHATRARTGLSLAWLRDTNPQFEVRARVGLNQATADVELYVGVARRF